MGFFDLPTLAEVQQQRRATPKGTTPTRLEDKWAGDRLRMVDAKTFRREVIQRDGRICRCCGVAVVETRERLPQRLEVHHLHGKVGWLKFEARCACVLCLFCHARVTGKVNDRLAMVPTRTFRHEGREYADARHPLRFVKVA